MTDLFAAAGMEKAAPRPLADRLRPTRLAEVVGQDHLVGPEGAITKLVMSELGHESAAIMSALSAEESAFMDGPGMISGSIVLMHRAMSIAGGTSEIKRNQIGERILGLPRDPLIK